MDVEKTFSRASEKYSDNTAVRAMVCGIPYVGSSLDVIFESKARKVIARRIETLFKSLQKELSDITEKSIKKDYLESEEFFDLVFQCINSAVKTRSRDKISLLSKIMRDAITTKEVKDITEEELLYVIDGLSSQDIYFVKFLYENKPKVSKEKKLTSGYSGKYLQEIEPTKNIDYYLYFLTKLEKMGLLSLNIRVSANWEDFVYKPTTLMDRIIKYLKNIS